MYFKRIELHGFKSFAEPVNIEFNQGITCIVGPNGSGKSNISDAIRWVLGEQSPKMLRGGKMEEVIFSGTESRKSRGMAEVTLVIDNEHGELPIDYKEVAITRRMFRTGESEYHINGNQCRLRDIRELIMDTGIGVDGYSIIGQGKISDILSNKTESRREIFEEAAGIVMYRTKKAEAERRLESTEANMERVQDIIGEIEGRIDNLREDSIKAKEYLALREKYKKLEINITLKNIENLELKNEYIKDDLTELKISIDGSRELKEELDARFESQRERNTMLEEIAAESQEKLLAAIEGLNQITNRGELDKERLKTIEDNSLRLKAEIEELESKIERQTQEEERLLEEEKNSNRELTEAEEKLQRKIADHGERVNEADALAVKIDENRNNIFELTGEISSHRTEINSLQSLEKTLDKRRELIQSEQEERQDSNRETLDRLNTLKHEEKSIKEAAEVLKETIKSSREDLQRHKEDEARASKEAAEARIQLGQLTTRKKTFEEMESNYEGYNYAVRHIMKSGLPGIEGVVADLITVPKGYEVAIETSLGASLQNIVCADDDSAKKAIKSLKENRAGRMTFLPLSSVRGGARREGSINNLHGFIGYGPDCIEYDERYKNILEYLLGRVVLVDNMDNAVKMSKKAAGYRVVTLEGEIINSGGAITGGKYKNKTANILDRKAEIAELGRAIDEKNNSLEKSSEALESLQNRIAALYDDIAEKEDRLREVEHQLIQKNNEMLLSEKALRDLKAGGEKIEKEMSNIAAEKDNSQDMIKALQEKIADKEKLVEDAKESSEALMEEYQEKKTSVDAVSEEITQSRIAVNNCQSRKDHLDEMLRVVKGSLDEMRSDREEKAATIENMANEKNNILSGSGDTDEQLRKLQSEKDNLEGYLAEISQEKVQLNESLTEINKEKDANSEKLEELQRQRNDLEIKNAKNETQLDTYKNKLWEDFEISYIQAMEFKSDEFVMGTAVKENKKIKSRIKELGEVNVGAIEEYETVKERYEFLTGQRSDIQEAVDNLNKIIQDTDRTIRTRFKENFDKIVINFEEKFRELFGGGHAELRLSDENNPLESSIDIVAQPPGKKLQNINLLSGGEKTLTAIALMFAVLKVKPTPFCILDEVEAALDDANIERFINSLRRLAGIQFTLVTHQKATMEHADVLYGVTMPEKGISKVLSLNLNEEI